MRSAIVRSLLTGWLLVGCTAEAPPPAAPPAPPPPIDQSFRTARPDPLAPVTLQRPIPQVAQLGNGFWLWVIDRPTPTVSLRISCRVGGRDNPVGKAGLAAITTRMLTEGTQKKSALQLAIAAESFGASLEHESGRDSSSLDLEVLPEHAERAIELLAEVVREPAFRAEDFARVQAEWVDDLTLQRQDPTHLAWLIGYRALLGPQQGVASQGTPSQVRSLKLDDVRKFMSSMWTPERCGMLAAGPISTSDIEPIVSDLLGDWPPRRGRDETPQTASPPGRRAVYVFDRPGAVQTAIFHGTMVPKRYAPGHEARQVLNNLFGGLFTSRLNLNLREKNAYTYGAFSTLVTTLDWGIWAVSTNVRSDVTAASLREIAAEFNQLLAPNAIGDEELQRARTDLIFKTSANLEHTGKLLDELEEIFVFELPAEYFAQYSDAVASVDAEKLGEQLKYTPRNNEVIALVGDQRQLLAAGVLDEYTRSVGLQWLDGTD